MSKLLSFAVAALIIGAAVPTVRAETDWSKVAQTLGKEGTVQPGNVYRVGFPRSDLHVTLDGVTLAPGFALGGWLAFDDARWRHGHGRSGADAGRNRAGHEEV